MIPFSNSTIGGKDDSLWIEIKTNHGLRLWIHDYGQPPYYEYKNNYGSYIQLSPGFKFHIVIEKIIQKRLELPYNNCFKDIKNFNLNKTIINYILNKGEKYTLTTCLTLCFELDYIEKNPCNCSNSTLGDVWAKCYINNVKKNSRLHV